MLAWFGGITVDLRDAELAPGASLTAHELFGGIDLQTPPRWRKRAFAFDSSDQLDGP